CCRINEVVERCRRSVKANRGRSVPELEVVRTHERAHVVEIVRAELVGPETPEPPQLHRDLVTAGGRRRLIEEEGVPVAHDHGTAELADARERLDRLWTDGDIAETDDPVDTLALELGERRVEREEVPVNVGDERDAHHVPSVRSRLTAALMSARCVNACGKF